MKAFFRTALCVLLMAMMPYNVSPMTAGKALAASKETVRIGVFEYEGYAQIDADGYPYGSAVESIYEIAEYAGFKAEVIPFSNTASLFAALDDSSLDAVFDASITPEREKKYLFSDNETGKHPICIYTSKDSSIAYDDTSELNGKTIGVEKMGDTMQTLSSYFDSCGLSVSYKEYDDLASINAAVDSSEIDAGAYSALSIAGYKVVLHTPPQPSYFAFRSESASLKETIDRAISTMEITAPGLLSNFSQKSVIASEDEMAAFSKEELSYIKDHGTVSIAVLKSDQPFFSTAGNGTCKGILPDYYAQLSKLTGLTFTFKTYENQSAAVKAVQSKEADVLGMFSNGIVAAHKNDFRLTSAYGTSMGVLVTKTGTDTADIHTIAIKERSLNVIRNGLDEETAAKLVTYDTAAKCFDALKKDTVDAMISGLPSATWMVNQTNSSAYTMSTISTIDMSMCGALSFDNTTLWSILNKAIQVSNYSYNSIVTNDTLAENTWSTFITRIPTSMLAVYSVIMLFTVLILIFAIVALIRRQKERTQLLRTQAENERKLITISAMEKRNEERNRFFSNISHDMRTPLNAIIGFSDLAGQKDVSPEVRDYLRKIKTSGNLLLELINDTLTISKISSGKQRLNEAPVSMKVLLDEIETPLCKMAEEKNIRMLVDTPANDRSLLCDKLNVQKILLNLLSNAVKYTNPGGTVEFHLFYVEEPGQSLLTKAVIKDTGIGISKEFLPHVFEPFEQENVGAGIAAGTGLGLSIVKQLVDLMHGTITVESEAGKGTEFTLSFPFKEAADQSSCTTCPEESVPVSFTGQKVLLCEDNELNMEIAQTLLTSWNLQCDAASNGKDGLSLFEASALMEYTAVLMDLRMPVMNGLDAATALRALDRPDAHAVPIIAMTADAFEEDIQKCFDAGMNDHIAKPLDPEVVKKTLGKWIH